MKNWISLSAVAAIVIAFVAIRPSYSDDSTDTSKRIKVTQKSVKSTAGKTAANKPKPKKKPKGRLPNYYAQIGISKQQREEIYSIQDAYSPQINELKKQMAALVARRDNEIQAVLTETQRADLAKAREESKKRALERIKQAAADRAKRKSQEPAKSE